MNTLRGVRWYILVLVALGTVVNYIDRNTLGILAPVRVAQFAVGASMGSARWRPRRRDHRTGFRPSIADR